MDAAQLVELLSRWVHVGTAIVLLGGSVFMRFVLLPEAAKLPAEQHDQLRLGTVTRWKRFVMAGITLLLVTGFYNYLTRESLPPRYHMLMGIKILLALGVFFLGSALTGRSAGLAAIRQNARTWLVVLIGLASLVVAIAGYLKIAMPPV